MASHHTRSNSFPSRPHPYTSEFNEHLSTIRASESTSKSSSSISKRVNGLQDPYDCVDKVLQLPLTQQALAQEQQSAYVHELLDGSLRLLDICSTAKDSLLQTKDSTHELQSILRRRRGGEFDSNDIKKYMSSRKVVKKAIHKALKNWKGTENQLVFSTVETVSMVKEAEAATITVLKSLLSLISGSKAQSFFSKLIHPNRIGCEKEETDVNEFEKVDAALHLFICNKNSNSDNIIYVQSQLKDLELCIQDLEEGLDCVYRRLIKTRVSLLNILNNLSRKS